MEYQLNITLEESDSSSDRSVNRRKSLMPVRSKLSYDSSDSSRRRQKSESRSDEPRPKRTNHPKGSQSENTEHVVDMFQKITRTKNSYMKNIEVRKIVYNELNGERRDGEPDKNRKIGYVLLLT